MRNYIPTKSQRREYVKNWKNKEQTRNRMEQREFERLHSATIDYHVTHDADLGIFFDPIGKAHLRRNFSIILNHSVPAEMMMKILDEVKPLILEKLNNAITDKSTN